ncbi:hypothetical protein OsJ_28742 [Oryza sativa Japonica Group]|uniref:DUF7771 domain-containing protein n=1 Tax=Oryza sativa subsp. japonica TaxID=39947 RepID=B9G2P2_ORYSJ|nr:hypothetical protein OsJ_28742 [Oryza sativa Japonica Group]
MSANMHLSCYAVQGGGRSEFYHSFRADPGEGLGARSWREATSGEIRRRGGGCNMVFDGHEMFVDGRSGGGGRRLLGDLPQHECQKMLLVFNRRCWFKSHRHPYVGRAMNGLTDYLMA